MDTTAENLHGNSISLPLRWLPELWSNHTADLQTHSTLIQDKIKGLADGLEEVEDETSGS